MYVVCLSNLASLGSVTHLRKYFSVQICLRKQVAAKIVKSQIQEQKYCKKVDRRGTPMVWLEEEKY